MDAVNFSFPVKSFTIESLSDKDLVFVTFNLPNPYGGDDNLKMQFETQKGEGEKYIRKYLDKIGAVTMARITRP